MSRPSPEPPKLSWLEAARFRIDLQLLEAWEALGNREVFDRETVWDAMRFAFELGREQGIDEGTKLSSPRNRGKEPASMAGRDSTTEADA